MAIPNAAAAEGRLDVLIVGAGPTGLTLAAQLQTFGVGFRLIDRNADRGHESRALAVQARTVEIFDALGIGEALVKRGNPSVRLALHFERGAAAKVELAGFSATDTQFPFILFVSQAVTEALLSEHVTRAGGKIERGVELVDAVADGEAVRCRLRHAGGDDEQVVARYVVGCDGAHSAVRKQAGIPFEGDAYLQDFMLGDVEADGAMDADTLHAYSSSGCVAMFFPLRTPATWRVIAMRGGAQSTRGKASSASGDESLTRGQLALGDLQAVVDGATAATVKLRDPVWLTHFRLHHRQASRYRSGRLLIAGDAAHIHSPVGGQGMNTGIQDAWNLGWKLALVVKGRAALDLLDTYSTERWPVGRSLLRYTDRAFSLFTRLMSRSRVAAWFRRTIAARLVPWVLSARPLRAVAFKFVSELGIAYRRSPAVAEGSPKLRGGPRAGDRLPDLPVGCNGTRSRLQRELAGPRLHLLLCGEPAEWSAQALEQLKVRHSDLVAIHHLASHESGDALVDASGKVLSRLGVRGRDGAAQYLVRPDGYIGARCAGYDLGFVSRYLARWLAPSGAGVSAKG
jgi:2-polyprenyl-6-methoxyphenol hydroxylase-like FAD-dependent oxidoreductase